MEILIGRDPQQSNLLIVVKHNDQTKATRIGQAGCVPNSVSRCNVANGTAHSLIDYDIENRKMRVKNLKNENVTYVNDQSIMSKSVVESDTIYLGKDRFAIPIKNVLSIIDKIIDGGAASQSHQSPTPNPVKSKSIAHLEKVWLRYEKTLENIRRKQQAMARKRLLPIMLSSCGGVVSAILGTMEMQHPMYVTLGLSILPLLMYIKIFSEKDTSIDDTKKADNELIAKYVCPHEDCHCYFNKQPFVVVKQWKACPHCKKPLHI